MDEEKDLNSNNQDVVDSDGASNNDTPVDEQNASDVDGGEANDVPKAGNGYGTLASSNRDAFARGLNENYDDRIARNQAMLNEARAREADPYKMKNGHEGEEKNVDSESGEANFKDKNVLDKAKDKADVLKGHAGVLSEKINKVRSDVFKVTNPGEAAKMLAQAQIKKLLLWAAPFIAYGLMFIFVTFIAAVFIVGLFEFDSDASDNLSYGGECGFTISSTSLSKSEYVQKVEEFAKKDSRAKIFAENAGTIFDLALSSNINPELVIIRAYVEGYSPGASKNNYWGIGCTNEGGYAACHSYGSFLEGVNAFIKNISKYSSLIDMMQSYAYIGKSWVKGNSADGGCYYFEYMKDYYDSSAEAQAAKQRAAAACAAGGTGIATNKYDQDAYASYQVNLSMSKARETIFGLTDKNSICSTGGEVSKSVSEMINLSDSEAWKAITGLNHKPKVGEISSSSMSSRMVTIEVPYRTWADSNDKVIGKVGDYNVTKKTQRITVNKAVAEVFKAFFTDVFNYAPNFVIRTWDGCYNFRTNTSDSSSFSAHAFGVACDINAGSKGNGYGQTAYTSWAQVQRNVSGKGQYEAVYKGSDIMKIAHKYTITNGSDWRKSHDAMHFSFIGDMTRSESKKLQNK